MTENERKAIKENTENIKHIDYYSAWLFNHLLTQEEILKWPEFNQALKTANQTELDTFIKILSCLHGTLSELYKTSSEKSLHTATEKAIKERFMVIGKIIQEEREEQEE